LWSRGSVFFVECRKIILLHKPNDYNLESGMFKRIAFAALAAALPICYSAEPPKAQSATEAPRGTLIIAGGGVEGFVYSIFYQASGGRGGAIGIIPCAASNPTTAINAWRSDLDREGIELVPLDIRTRDDSSSAAMLEAASRCGGFWFSSGTQTRITDRIVGTPMHDLLLQKYREGACMGGGSAGAAIMSEIMLTGTGSLANMAIGAFEVTPGLGFMPSDCIVDQHFLERTRHNRIFSLMMEHPGKLGLGIDEDTALVVKDGVAVVHGNRAVMVFDTAGMTQDSRESFQNMKIHLLRRGHSIDLATRQVSQ
jgi:cyanophycinase